MLKSSSQNYGDAYVLVKGIITLPNTAAAAADVDNKKVIFKNCALFHYFISKINNIQTDNAKDLDVVIPMYKFNRIYQ